MKPTESPSAVATAASSTKVPTMEPTEWPSAVPTRTPSTKVPTKMTPTGRPTRKPTTTGSPTTAESNTWSHGSYAVASTNNVITIQTPTDTEIGDTLFLFLSRTDDFLPMDLDQWTRGAACYKSNNKQRDCFRASDCIAQDGSYCRTFDRVSYGSTGTKYTYSGSGQDLATVMFHHKVTASTPASWGLTLWGTHPTWAIITAIPNVKDQDPINKTIGVARTSCDNQAASVYPSVYGGEGDILFLSQAFDDTASSSDFTTPDGTTRLGWIRSSDEVSIVCYYNTPNHKAKTLNQHV